MTNMNVKKVSKNPPSASNPCGLDGFAFLEFSGPDVNYITSLFEEQGYTKYATHKSKPISWYQQGDIQFLVNHTQSSQASHHASIHGAGACAMGFLVHDAKQALQHAIEKGAQAFDDAEDICHGLPAIQAIGGSVIYFVDEHHTPFQGEWDVISNEILPGHGLLEIDHLTHNVRFGNMDTWANFYKDIFCFEQIRFFDIKGQATGLVSRAMGSPCGKIKIPLNESKDEQSQIEEFIRDYHGEGIQHIALSTSDIYHSVSSLGQSGVQFLDVPDTYYEGISARVPWHQEPIHTLQSLKILIDGTPTPEGGLLLQIFTQNLFGPVFFEIIQRKGNDGFGEGNFQALFEAIERDQIRRGTLTIEPTSSDNH